MIKTTFESGTKAASEEVNQNFIDLLNLSIYNETPTGFVNGINIDYATAFKFKPGMLRVYLSKVETTEGPTETIVRGMVRLQRNAEYQEVLDPSDSTLGIGFQMTVAAPTGAAFVIDYQRANAPGNIV